MAISEQELQDILNELAWIGGNREPYSIDAIINHDIPWMRKTIRNLVNEIRTLQDGT